MKQFTPFQPILELLRGFFGLSQADDVPSSIQKIERQLLRTRERFGDDELAVLQEFVGLSIPAAKQASLDPRTRLSKLRMILRRIIKSKSDRPSSIIIEDFHWLDEPSHDFIEAIANAVADTRALLVVTFRPPLETPWQSYSHYRELRLPELALDVIHTFVEDLVGSGPELEPIRSRICQRSGGNPFFAEELVHALTEAGMLKGAPGRLSIAAEVEHDLLPVTVHATVGARIDHLADADKEVLNAGSIIGDVFPLQVLQRVTGFANHKIVSSITRLADAEMVQPCLADNPEYVFRHPLIREVAYNSQLKAQRTALHAIVAKALEEHYRLRIDEFSGLLAFHHKSAGDLQQASRFAEKAAAWVGKTDTSQAAKRWKKVLALLEAQPSSEQNIKHRVNACGQVINFGWRSNPGMTAEEAKPYAEKALSLARSSGNTMVQTLILVGYGRIVICGGSAEEYVALTKEALSLIPETDGRAATLNGNLAQAYCFAGCYERQRRRTTSH